MKARRERKRKVPAALPRGTLWIEGGWVDFGAGVDTVVVKGTATPNYLASYLNPEHIFTT